MSIKYAVLTCLLLLVAGCAPMARVMSATTATPTGLMAFQDHLNRAAPADLVKQYNALSAIPEPARSDGEVIELALLLSQPGLPIRNDATALRLLQDREAHLAADARLAPFIHWLRASLQERIRLAGNTEDAAEQLRDEKKRADACSDKLQAIRKMEDSLIERNRH